MVLSFFKIRFKGLSFFLAVVTPVLVLGAVSYFQLRNALTDAAFARRASIEQLMAALVHERLDRLVDVSVSIASRSRLREAVAAGRWGEAAAMVNDVSQNFEYIARIELADPEGTVFGDTIMPSDVVGQNLSYRDWFKGVSAKWEPYVSSVYHLVADPDHNSVAIAVPIRLENRKVVGILMMQVVTDTFLEWSKKIDVGVQGFAYLTDQRGQLVAHPQFLAPGQIVDFSSAPAVAEALRGESGTGIFYNPIDGNDNVIAYGAVDQYHWGVVVSQPAAVAFSDRDRSSWIILVVYGFILIITVVLAYSVVRLREREEENIRFREGTLLQVVHDLRAPSNVIRLIVARFTPEFIAKYPELKEDAVMIQKANARMLNLIQYLFEIVKGERGGMEFRRDPIDVATVVEGAVKELEPMIRSRALTLDYQKPPAPPIILGDWDRLKEIFVNLIDNAAKYNRENGSIAISYQMGKNAVTVNVRDTGRGISSENAPRVFLPYFRENTGDASGVGLGLSIVKNFVEKMGGKIAFESKEEEGTTFSVTFPLAP